MTRAELIEAINRKTRKAKPFIQRPFIRSLKYKSKPELQRILKKVHVDRDGYGISLI